MNRKLLNRILVAAAVVVSAAIFFFAQQIFMTPSSQVVVSPTPSVQDSHSMAEIKIGDVPVQVEIAQTSEEQEKGLSGRDSLAEDQGMLFVYKEPAQAFFWMKEMQFPLDILWIANGKVVGFEEDVPVPSADAIDANLPRYSPTLPITAVLEVNAGFVQKNKIKIGDKVQFSNLDPSL